MRIAIVQPATPTEQRRMTLSSRLATAINGTSAATAAGPSPAADPDPADVSRVAAIVIEVLQRSGFLPPPADFLSMKEFTKMLGISEKTGWTWLQTGQLGPTGIRRGGKRLFPRFEAEAYIRAGAPSREIWLPMWKAMQGRPK